MLRLLLHGCLWPWLILAVGCADSTQRPERPRVFASIEPVAGFLDAIAGSNFEVEVLVGPGASPVTFEPTSRQLTRLAAAGQLFTVGVPFERSLTARLDDTFPNLQQVALGREFEAAPVKREAASSAHVHIGLDPHRWLDPMQAAEMVETIAEALIASHPAQAEAILERAERLGTRLEEAHEELSVAFGAPGPDLLLTYHPAYGHFAERYGLEQLAIEEDGREPGPRHLAEVLGAAQAKQATVLLVQPQQPRRSADAVARELGLPTSVVDPLQRDVFVVWEQLQAALRPLTVEASHE